MIMPGRIGPSFACSEVDRRHDSVRFGFDLKDLSVQRALASIRHRTSGGANDGGGAEIFSAGDDDVSTRGRFLRSRARRDARVHLMMANRTESVQLRVGWERPAGRLSSCDSLTTLVTDMFVLQ